jgi:hypothetical protein
MLVRVETTANPLGRQLGGEQGKGGRQAWASQTGKEAGSTLEAGGQMERMTRYRWV